MHQFSSHLVFVLAPGPCLVAGTIPTNRNAVLTGGRGSHRHSWVLPSVRVQNCSVTVRGFEIYHSSMTDCNLTVSLWRPQQNTTNRYNVLYNTSPATLSKDSSFVRHFFSQSDQYQISNSTTSVVFGLITHNTGCRILGNDITTDRAQFRTNTSNIDSIGRRRIFGKYQTIDVAFRVLFQGKPYPVVIIMLPKHMPVRKQVRTARVHYITLFSSDGSIYYQLHVFCGAVNKIKM